MPLISSRIYFETEDYPYEIAVSYQLKYYINSALISLDFIDNPSLEQTVKFPNSPQYYRFYLDQVFYCVGQINDRLIPKDNRNTGIAKDKQYYMNVNYKVSHSLV